MKDLSKKPSFTIICRDYLRKLHAIAENSYLPILNIIFPPLCPVCKARVWQNGMMCLACWTSLDFIAHPAFQPNKKPQANILGAVNYSGAAEAIVHKLKYQDQTMLATLVAKIMFSSLRTQILKGDVIIPVPVDKSRLYWRKYNHSAFIAARISRLSGIPVALQALIKTRKTKPQATLSAVARKTNLHGAFTVKQPEKIRDKHIILLDDIASTGSTLRECAKALRPHQPKTITSMVFAHNI